MTRWDMAQCDTRLCLLQVSIPRVLKQGEDVEQEILDMPYITFLSRKILFCHSKGSIEKEKKRGLINKAGNQDCFGEVRGRGMVGGRGAWRSWRRG